MGCRRRAVKPGGASIYRGPGLPATIKTSAALADIGMGVARCDQAFEGRCRRSVDEAVDPLRAEVALECCHGVARGAIEMAGGRDIVAVVCQQRLRLLDGGIGVAWREGRSRLIGRRGLDP